MISLSTGLRFLRRGGAPVTGGSITVPDDPGGDPGDGDTGGNTGGGDPGGPDLTPATLPLTPTARWHAAASTVTLDGTRVTSASDMTGLAAVIGATGSGPQALTDALGYPFWRFDEDSFLTVANDLVLSSRDMTVFMVGRFHRTRIKTHVFALGSEAAGTATNTNGSALQVTRNGNGMPLMQTFSKPSVANYGPASTMVAGSQMQVVGMVGRAGAVGGCSLWLNEDRVNTGGALNYPGIAGAEIGRQSHSPGASGSWGGFDLYEMVVYDRSLSDAEGDSLAAALTSAWAIAPLTDQLVLEGDSIMQGTGDVTPALSAGMILTDPGTGHIGANWRVVNLAASGDRVPDLETKRDATLGWPDIMAPGRNVLAFEIGRNDLSPSFGITPAQHYANVVAYLTDDVGTTGTNILDRGWDVRVMANIASSVNFETAIADIRARWRDPAFAVDLGTDAGGAYPGQMQVIDTDLITVGGETVFADVADAGDPVYYAGDSTHPTLAGAIARATGGDDASKGIAAGL